MPQPIQGQTQQMAQPAPAQAVAQPAQQQVPAHIGTPSQNVVPFNTVQGGGGANGTTLAELVHGRAQPQVAPAPTPQQAQANGLSPEVIAHIARVEAENAAFRATQGVQQGGAPAPAAEPNLAFQYIDPVEMTSEMQAALGNIYDPMNTVADARFQENMNPLLQRFNDFAAKQEQRFAELNDRYTQMRETMFNNDLANVAPDIQQIKNHARAREYFAQTSIDGTSYASMLADAEKRNDVNAIGKIAASFKAWDAQQNPAQNQQGYQQMQQPQAQQQYQDPNMQNPFYQPPVGQGDQAQSYVPSMPQQQAQGQVRASDYAQKADQLSVDFDKAMQDGDKVRASEINIQREALADAALVAMEQGQIVPA